MAMNQVQFQPGLSMAKFLERYGTEAKCYRALYTARWPLGFRCPCCNGRARSRFRREGRVYYQCRACRHQTTLTSGTLFEASKVPLTTWFLAMHLLTASKTNLSALELKRHLGVCYRTAWRMKQKIMEAMTEREEGRQLAGFVQIDDAYLGGELNGGKPGRGSENKQPFIIAVSTDEDLERPTYAVIEPVRSFSNEAMLDWAGRRRPRSCAYRAPNRGRPRGHRSQRRALGQRRARQRQASDQRPLPRRAPSQICSALSCRSCLPVQPPLSPALHAAATRTCHDALQALLRVTSAYRNQFPWLRFDANQEGSC